MLKIYGVKTSSNVQKVLWCCGELGLAFQREDVGSALGNNRTPAYLSLNPERGQEPGIIKLKRQGFNSVGAPVYHWVDAQHLIGNQVVQIGDDGTYTARVRPGDAKVAITSSDEEKQLERGKKLSAVRGRFFTFCSALSLLICVAAGAEWGRSLRVSDGVWWGRGRRWVSVRFSR